MNNIDTRFMYYRRIKIYRRILLFFAGVGITLAVIFLYIYELERMPDVIYVQSGKEQILDFHVPVSGVLYKEEMVAKQRMEAVESISSNSVTLASINVDFSKKVIISGAQDSDYYADLKLFGFLPYKTVKIESMDVYEVFPSGQTIGIYIKTDGVYVVDTGEFQSMNGETVNPCNEKLQSGDYITEVNGESVSRKKDFVQIITDSVGATLYMTIIREDEELTLEIAPVMAEDGTYKIGAWVRDSLQGVGTLTFVDADGNYAALGHAIRDTDTNEVVDISSGALYETSVVSISRGEKGEPGEITGLIKYKEDKIIAEVADNTEEGIYGTIVQEKLVMNDGVEPVEVALKQEVELGKATIISMISGERREYEIEIIDIDYNSDNKKAMTLQVTDEELLELTGGVIQGMSGSPVIQNGRIIGAVTHVLVNDPTKGYAIFIENMLKHDN